MQKLITLMTDFGTMDGFVGAMKGCIRSISPTTEVMDITHDISPQSCVQGAYTFKRYASQFPKGTIHVVVVDPGVGSSRKALLVETESYSLIGPDNGVFSLFLEEHPPKKIWSLKRESPFWKAHPSFD
mgnify:CR=1 FL=1